MRATIDLDDELEKMARIKAGGERKTLSQVVNEALKHYLPAKMVIEFGKLSRVNTSGPTISQTQLDK